MTKEKLRDGQPCGHPGCENHVTHPCEKCGRIQAQAMPKKCPFEGVEKEIGHKPYIIQVDGWWYVQCTCGARGPMSPKYMSVGSWNNRRTPAKDEGEEPALTWLTCPHCHESHTYRYRYRVNEEVCCVRCGAVWQPKPTAPADEGEERTIEEIAGTDPFELAGELLGLQGVNVSLQAALAEKEKEIIHLREAHAGEMVSCLYEKEQAEAVVDAAHGMSISLHTLEADGVVIPDYVGDAWKRFTIADQAALSAHDKEKK